MDHKNFQRLNFACDNPVSIRPFRYEYSTHANYDQTYSYRDKRPSHKLRIVKWFCGLSVSFFFFFLPQIHLFFVQTSYAWNIAYINYAAAILFYRSSVLTFQLFKLIYFYDILLPSRIPSRNIGSIMRFNSLYVFQYLKILFLIISSSNIWLFLFSFFEIFRLFFWTWFLIGIS